MKKQNKKTNKYSTKELNLKEKAMIYIKESNKVCEKIGLKVQPMIVFPNGPKRLMARLAIFLLKREKAILDTTFTNIDKK